MAGHLQKDWGMPNTTAAVEAFTSSIDETELDELNEYRLREPALQMELASLRTSQRRLDALWEMMEEISEAIGENGKISLGPTNELDLHCCSCARVLSLVHSCAAILAAEGLN